MTCQVINNSGIDLTSLEPHVQGMYDYFDQKIGFQKPPVMVFDSDPSNQSKVLGKTAYYDPVTFEIHIFTDGRHPKDMLRSIAHELIHHQQNEEGRLNVGGYMGEGYYLKNEAMRELEQEAMLDGNAFMREYEDKRKLEEKSKMSLKEWKNNELNKNLLKKFGILKEGVPTVDKEKLDPEEGDVHDGPGPYSIHKGKMVKAVEEELDESSCSTHRKKNEELDEEKDPDPRGRAQTGDSPTKTRTGKPDPRGKRFAQAAGVKSTYKKSGLKETVTRLMKAKKITINGKNIK